MGSCCKGSPRWVCDLLRLAPGLPKSSLAFRVYFLACATFPESPKPLLTSQYEAPEGLSHIPPLGARGLSGCCRFLPDQGSLGKRSEVSEVVELSLGPREVLF